MWAFWAELSGLAATILLCWPAVQAGRIKITQIRLNDLRRKRRERRTSPEPTAIDSILHDVQKALAELDEAWARRDRFVLYTGILLILFSSITRMILLMV